MKKILSIILSAVMIFSVSAVGFSSHAVYQCNCDYTPIIYVTGFAMTDLVANEGTEDEYSVFMPETDAIMDAVKTLIFPAVVYMLTGNSDYFAHSTAKAFNNVMRDAACDEEGNPINPNVDIEYRNGPYSYHRNTYNYFRYDWREDIFDIAAELNEYIEKTKQVTGHDKVSLKSVSMGGAVTMAYLYEYGDESIDSILMESSAFNGISLMGSMFNGELDINADAVINFIGDFLEGNDVQTVFYRALLNTLGRLIMKPLAKVLDTTVKSTQDILYDECIRDLFGNIPGVWTFVPHDRYESAKEYMLDPAVNSKLIAKIDKYQNEVMANTKQLLDDAMADGVKLAIVSNYGKGAVPVIKNSLYQSDFLIDTAFTSMGATSNNVGETLGEGYIQAVDDGHNHISADNIIDASTCAYPEYTWFVKDMNHTWFNHGYNELTFWLAYSPVQPTVHDNPNFPQFMVENHETSDLDILTQENSNTTSTDVNWIELIKSFKK